MDERRSDLASWNEMITDAIEHRDPVLANFKITRVHYLLSRALEQAIGPDAGANFHSWAVWGSRKAGITIRQEDKDQAARDATIVAGVVGALVGVSVGSLLSSLVALSWLVTVFAWVVIGAMTGGYCGYLLAGYTRRAASRLVLQGNCIVLDDIGRETARYLEYVEQLQQSDADPDAEFEAFVRSFRSGPTGERGQDLLRQAFENYEASRRSSDAKVRHECNYFANCLAVLHEHIRLQPFISRSLPFLIRKCVTQRLMTYSVGEELLAVHEDVPPLDLEPFPSTLTTIGNDGLRDFLNGDGGWDRGRDSLKNTRASDWTDIRQRMGYIVNLFRTRHSDMNVTASPYTPEQLNEIASNRLPSKPW